MPTLWDLHAYPPIGPIYARSLCRYSLHAFLPSGISTPHLPSMLQARHTTYPEYYADKAYLIIWLLMPTLVRLRFPSKWTPQLTTRLPSRKNFSLYWKKVVEFFRNVDLLVNQFGNIWMGMKTSRSISPSLFGTNYWFCWLFACGALQWFDKRTVGIESPPKPTLIYVINDMMTLGIDDRMKASSKWSRRAKEEMSVTNSLFHRLPHWRNVSYQAKESKC